MVGDFEEASPPIQRVQGRQGLGDKTQAHGRALRGRVPALLLFR